jgi:hypothetical protein
VQLNQKKPEVRSEVCNLCTIWSVIIFRSFKFFLNSHSGGVGGVQSGSTLHVGH